MPCAWTARAAKSTHIASKRRRIRFSPKKRRTDFTSEEVSDGEFKEIRLVDGPAGEREPGLEAERTERREPAQADADRVEEPERERAPALVALEDVLVFAED